MPFSEQKLRLKSDCNKEIEEVIAEIRMKYEVKCQETEAAFLLKKTELDTYHSKVLMNKILAEAFHSKCLGTLRMQQGMKFLGKNLQIIRILFLVGLSMLK